MRGFSWRSPKDLTRRQGGIALANRFWNHHQPAELFYRVQRLIESGAKASGRGESKSENHCALASSKTSVGITGIFRRETC